MADSPLDPQSSSGTPNPANSPNPAGSYPPPPPASSVPPAGGGPGFRGYPPPGYNAGFGTGYGPNYDARAWKAQARAQRDMWKAQARMQRDQIRAQYRAARRYSVVGPLFLLLIGVVFLLLQTGHLSWNRAMIWYGHWWPLLLIGAGLLMLAEWALNGRRGALLGGGMVTLLIFLGIFGWTAGEVRAHTHWNGDSFEGWTPLFGGELHEEDGAPLNSAVAAGGTLLIHNAHGDVTVTGASDDGQVHVTVHKEIRAMNDSETANRSRQLQPEFTGAADALQLSVAQIDGSHADLQVTVPRGVTLTVDAEHGAVSVAEMHAPVSISAGQGEVSLSGITGQVTAHLHNRNGSLSAHSVTGGVSVDGRGGDMNFSDIAGPVALQGEFFGTTHMERVNGAVSFETFRTLFKAARLDGELEISSGDDAPLQGEAILGPVVLHTSDRVITLDRVQGNVEINNSNGAVSLTSAGPLGAVSVHNRRGSVDVGIPAEAGFTLDAQTHDGDIDNEFGLKVTSGGDRPTLTGTVGRGGPAITLLTDDGDVKVRKSSAQPLPASMPTAPALKEGQATTGPSASTPAQGKPKKASHAHS